MLFRPGATLQNETMSFRFDFRQVTSYQEVWVLSQCVESESSDEKIRTHLASQILYTESFMLSIGIYSHCCLQHPTLVPEIKHFEIF